jgi:2-oxoglutarate dehydrogenase E1 component
MELALRYRQEFSSDVVVDMVLLPPPRAQRGRQPSFTRPAVQEIEAHPICERVFAKSLIASGAISEADEKSLREKHQAILDRAFQNERKEEGDACGPRRKFLGSKP